MFAADFDFEGGVGFGEINRDVAEAYAYAQRGALGAAGDLADYSAAESAYGIVGTGGGGFVKHFEGDEFF